MADSAADPVTQNTGDPAAQNTGDPAAHTAARRMGFEFSMEVAATQEIMWATMTDHVRWSDWMPGKEVVLETPGAPEPNGLGAVRVFKVIGGLSASREEVVGWEPPHSMSYTLRSSFPMKHYLSTMKLVPDGQDSCRLFWKSSWESAVPVWLGGRLVGKWVGLLAGKLAQRLLRSAASKMAAAANREMRRARVKT